MTSTTSQIAQHLNVLESAVIRVEEWAHVMFAVVKGIGARFVSKKIIVEEVKMITTEMLEAVGGSHWTKGSLDRVYFDITDFVELSNSKTRKLGGAKLYYCNDREDFFHTATVCLDEVKSAIQSIKNQLESVKLEQPDRTGMMITSTGEWVSIEDWDDIEGAM